ncbi:MAG TPA: ACT domain-containing protein, partial [Candidatus Sericytochromatia bacterium]
TAGFRIDGRFGHVAVPLAADISIFAISTYDTDYVLVKQSVLERAVQVWLQAGHQVVPATLTHTAS